jgi:hypothetical protein
MPDLLRTSSISVLLLRRVVCTPCGELSTDACTEYYVVYQSQGCGDFRCIKAARYLAVRSMELPYTQYSTYYYSVCSMYYVVVSVSSGLSQQSLPSVQPSTPRIPQYWHSLFLLRQRHRHRHRLSCASVSCFTSEYPPDTGYLTNPPNITEHLQNNIPHLRSSYSLLSFLLSCSPLSSTS